MVALLHQNRSASSSSSPLRGLLYLGVVALFLVALKHAAGGFDLSWSGTRQGQQQTSTQEAKVLKEALELEQPADKGQADAGVQAAFSSIYAGRTWGQDGNGSGAGSSLSYTSRTRAVVEMLVYKLDLDALMDAPCGGMTWMPVVLERVWAQKPSFLYYGVDIVESVIAQNKVLLPTMKFDVLDFSSQPLPVMSGKGASAIFTRDALQHLPYQTIVGALENFARSSATYLVVGSYFTPGTNTNIGAGDYFSINLLEAPFNLPPPMDAVEEETPDKKNLFVYRIADLKKIDFAAMRARAN